MSLLGSVMDSQVLLNCILTLPGFRLEAMFLLRIFLGIFSSNLILLDNPLLDSPAGLLGTFRSAKVALLYLSDDIVKQTTLLS